MQFLETKMMMMMTKMMTMIDHQVLARHLGGEEVVGLPTQIIKLSTIIIKIILQKARAFIDIR